jgi:hypothetical protein
MPDPRRSKIVLLSVIGLPMATIGIADMLPSGTTMRRNNYADRAACERDYPPDQCQSSSSGGGSYGGSGGGFHGPYYTASRSTAPAGDPGPGRSGIAPASVETSVRGGFGSFGRAAAATG